MSAKQLRSERLATGIAGIAAAFTALSRTSSPRVTLVGQISQPDPFQGVEFYFPDDLKTIDHWIEFTAKETKSNPTVGKTLTDLADKVGFSTGGLGGSTVTGATFRLPMPSNLSTDYNPLYSSANLGAGMGQILKPFDQQIYNSSLQGQMQGAGSAGASGISNILAGAGGAVGGLALDGLNKSETFGAGLKVGLGVAVNPHKIVLFTGVDFRDHRFSWKLSPRSRDESDRIRNMIKAFTRYAHPEFIGGGLFFKYPEFFEIKFHHPGYLFNLQPSVCTDIQVNYHSQGVAAYIRNADGSGEPAPAEVELTLSFKETEIITKNYLDDKSLNYTQQALNVSEFRAEQVGWKDGQPPEVRTERGGPR
jgi:hypothetical protein